MAEVLVSGYVSMDHIIKIETPAKVGFTSLVTNKSNAEIYYGGCSVNIAYSLCKLGINTAPLIRVGYDFESTGFRSFLEEGNVSFEGIKRVQDEPTSICYLLQDNNNDHTTIFYPGSMDGKYSAEIDNTIFDDTRLAVITVAAESDNRRFFDKCIERQIPIAFGMKDDFNAFPKPFLKEILSESTVIFMNEIESTIISDMYNFKDITELFEMGKADIIIKTLGENGSLLYIRTKSGISEERVGIVPVNNVVDATGSGDAYMAGFLYGYLTGLAPSKCACYGGALSSFVLQKEGCCTNIPNKEELIDVVNMRRGD